MNRFVVAGFQEVAAQLPPSFEAFQSEALAAGCDEALGREWQPKAVPNAHTHRFGVEAIVVRGEMWLPGVTALGTSRPVGRLDWQPELCTASATGEKVQHMGWVAGKFLRRAKTSIRCSFRAGSGGVGSGNWSHRKQRVFLPP